MRGGDHARGPLVGVGYVDLLSVVGGGRHNGQQGGESVGRGVEEDEGDALFPGEDNGHVPADVLVCARYEDDLSRLGGWSWFPGCAVCTRVL